MNQSLHQPIDENQEDISSLFSELQPITNLSEYSACLYRAETSTTDDLRSPSSTSGEVQLSGEHNSTALTQGHLKQSEPKQKLLPVPLALRCGNEDDNTRIMPSVLSKRKYLRKLVSVPLEYRRRNEDEHTRINSNALSLRKHARKLFPVPPEHRRRNEDEHTQVSPNALSLRKQARKLVPVPLEHRLRNEDEHTLISCRSLANRKRKRELVPVPPEHRLCNEGEHTLISRNALEKRKRKKLKLAALSGEKPLDPHQTEEASAANTLTDSNSSRQNSPILTRSPSGSNASPLRETTSQGTLEADETLPPFESETAFFHWLDDLNVQQIAIDYSQNFYW
ncbi:MAG: hypothetical protein P8176_04800 [Gammaproteobacteria bacterium]